MSAVAEPIQGALGEQRFIEYRHPFFNASIRSQDGGTASVTLDQQVIKIRSGLAGQLLQTESIDDKKIGINESAQFTVERVIRTRTGQVFQQQVGPAEQHAIARTAGRMAESLGKKGLADTNRAAKDHVFLAFDEVQTE